MKYIREKYVTVRICPIDVYGVSTGFAPIHVKSKTLNTSIQNRDFFNGENFLLNLLLFKHGIIKHKMAISMAITPPSFEGIARRIAYAKRKYHSG